MVTKKGKTPIYVMDSAQLEKLRQIQRTLPIKDQRNIALKALIIQIEKQELMIGKAR